MAGEGQNLGGEQSQNPGGESQQEQVATWVPAEFKDAPAVKKFKGKDWNEVGPQVLKSYINLEKWQIPGEGASPEEITNFHRRLGVPEKASDYKLKVEVPEGVQWDPAVETSFSEFAHAEGITPRQAEKVLNWYLGKAKQGTDIGVTQKAESLKKATETLKSTWGANWQRNTGLVQREVDGYGSAEFRALLDNIVVDGMTLGNHPVMLEYLRSKGEDSLEAGLIAGDSLLTTNADAEREMNAILNDAKHAYWKRDDPGHKDAVAKVAKLMALVHPDVKRT